jgi:hypothetical protein
MSTGDLSGDDILEFVGIDIDNGSDVFDEAGDAPPYRLSRSDC